MGNGEDIADRLLLGNETLLLCLAAGLAIVFLGLLVFDIAKRRKQKAGQRREPEGLRARLLRLFHRGRALQGDLAEMLEERSRRKRGESWKPPEPPP